MRGKETADNAGNHANGDHPRLCGEKLSAQLCTIHRAGSPPPMRGKAAETHTAGFYKRITPAYAGKRFVNVGNRFWKWDHPRLCGEKW